MNAIERLIIKTHKAAADLRNTKEAQIVKALKALSREVNENTAALIKANGKDMEKGDANDPKKDRLLLNAERIKSIANSILQISKLPDPSGKVLEKRILYNAYFYECH